MTDRDTTPRRRPSQASVIRGAIATLMAIGMTIYIATGLLESYREFAGFGLGIVASLMLLAETMDRAVSWAGGERS